MNLAEKYRDHITGFYSDAFEAFDRALSEHYLGYTCDDVARALDAHATVEQAIEMIENRKAADAATRAEELRALKAEMGEAA